VNSAPHRFAFVTSLLDVGGSTTWLCDLAGELHRRGFPVHVFCLKADHPLAEDYRRRQIPVTRQDDRRLIYEERLLGTLNALRDFQPTVVVGWTGTPAFEVLRYLPPGIARIGVLHSDYGPGYDAMKPYEPLMDAIAVLSQRMLEAALDGFRCAPSKIRIVRLGVHVATETPRSARGSEPLRILYLGRVQQEQKRVLLFPEILRHLRATGMPFTWTVAGDGPAKEQLEAAMVTSHPQQTVRVIGRVAYANVPELLEAHDVFLLASDYEGLSHTLLEAMGHGLVPVVSDIPSGMREVVDETTGRLVDVNDVAGYARAIHWLHTHREDFAKMARAAAQRVRSQFSIPIMTEQWLAMIPPPTSIAPWPEKFALRRPLVHSWPWAFVEPLRTVRRIARRLSAQ
jgi:glycosyltransferase involved in cell wall biosynthesis